MNPKLVLWCGDSANHRALANKLHDCFELGLIIVDKKQSRHKNNSVNKKSGLVEKIVNKLKFFKIDQAWIKMQAKYDAIYPHWPDVKKVEVDSINSDISFSATINSSPDLVIVSGTQLVKDKMLTVPSTLGIINLHTGLSPYVKGGPNCTNWCIANNTWHLVGNTIMWINAGIDTGNIITTETIDIRSTESLFEAHYKVMEHAHALYLKAIKYLLNNSAPYVSVPQAEITKGQLYLTKMWDNNAKSRLLSNWAKRKKAQLEFIPKTVSLPGE